MQNLTEINSQRFEQKSLKVGLCDLAYRAEISVSQENVFRQTAANDFKAGRTDWHLRAQIRAFEIIRNSLTNKGLYWINPDAGDFDLEVLVSRDALQGGDLQVGKNIEADIRLQGHIAAAANLSYEGIDRSHSPVDFWNKFRRKN